MAAAGLLVAALQHLVAGVQKQDAELHLHAPQLVQAVLQRLGRPAAPGIQHHGHLAQLHLLLQRKPGKASQQPRGDIVDAEIAHVLQGMDSQGFAGT